MIDRLFQNVTDEDIQQLIDAGEGTQIEFRSDIRTVLDLARLASAFANTEGGVLLVGVRDDRTPIECNTARISELVSRLGERITPVPEVRMHVHNYQGVNLAVVVITRTQQLAVSDAGAYRRVGGSTVLITAQLMQQVVPQNEPPEITNQHLREMLEAMNERLAAVHDDVQYPRSLKGRMIALLVAFLAGFAARIAAEQFSAFTVDEKP